MLRVNKCKSTLTSFKFYSEFVGPLIGGALSEVLSFQMAEVVSKYVSSMLFYCN